MVHEADLEAEVAGVKREHRAGHSAVGDSSGRGIDALFGLLDLLAYYEQFSPPELKAEVKVLNDGRSGPNNPLVPCPEIAATGGGVCRDRLSLSDAVDLGSATKLSECRPGYLHTTWRTWTPGRDWGTLLDHASLQPII